LNATDSVFIFLIAKTLMISRQAALPDPEIIIWQVFQERE
jgi:hypothetical protein